MEQQHILKLLFLIFSYVSVLCLFNVYDMPKHKRSFQVQGSVVLATLQTQRQRTCLPGAACTEEKAGAKKSNKYYYK